MSSVPLTVSLTKADEVGGALLQLCLRGVAQVAAGRNDGALECLAEGFQVLLAQVIVILDIGVACSRDDTCVRIFRSPLEEA